jgi:hypothetical protein
MKVRLTAEGIQDVMSALKKVQGGVEKTAKAGKDATDALGSLGTIFAARQLAGFVANALDAADGLYKMSQKTGVAVDQLSIFTYQAQQAEVSNDDLAKGFAKLAKSMDALASGDTKTVEAFKRIGLSANELKGLSLDQVMLKIANAQAGFADGAGKAAIMMQVFGKSGSNLIPLMNDLANGGFENARAKLQELGLVISSDMAKASQDFNDSMTRLKMAAEGAAVQVAQGMLPGLTSSIDALTKALAAMPIGTKAFAGSFVAIGTAATAASVAVRMLYTAIAGLGPIGLAVVALSALTAGLIAWNAAEEAAQTATVKANAELRERVTSGNKLVDAYAKEAAALDRGGLSAKAKKEHEEKLKTIQDALIKLGPDYKDVLDRQTGSLKEQAEAFKAVNAAHAESLRIQLEEVKAAAAAEEAAFRLESARRAQESYQARQQQAALTGALPGGAEEGTLKANVKALEEGLARIRAKYQPQLDALNGATTTPAAVKPEIPTATGSDGAALLKASTAEFAAQAKREYELQKQNLASMTTLTEEAYKDGLLSLQDYLDGRKALLEMGTQAELDQILKQIAAEEKARDGAKKPEERQVAQTKINDLSNQLVLKQQEGEAKLQALEREGDDKRKAAAEEILKLEAELETAKGRTGEAAVKAIEAEWDARIRAAQSDPNKAALLTDMKRLAVLKEQEDILRKRGDVVQATLGNTLAGIDQDQTAGKIGRLDADQKRVEAYHKWIAEMQEIQDLQMKIATQIDDPALTAALQAQQIQIDGVKNSVALLSNEWASVQQAGAEALSSGMVDLLMQVGNGADAVADSFMNMARSIVQAIQQAIVKMMLLKAMQSMFGGSPAGSFGATMISAFSHAAGGEIHGPGTGTSDSIPAWLSNGEFVMPAVATSFYGPDFFHALKGLRIPKSALPRFAEGGLAGGGAQPQTFRSDVSGTIGVELSEGLILKVLESPAAVRIQAKNTSANSKRFNRALGRDY